MSMNNLRNSKISTAVILSAGNGIRLLPLTQNVPKCLIEVNGIPIIVQLIDSLQKDGFKKIIIVIGYLSDKIVKVIQEKNRWKNIKIEFVYNKLFSTTNNIYSLWLARNKINDAFVLVESDVVFDSFLLDEILTPDRIALADYNPSMTGTTVTLDNSGFVCKMNVGKALNDTYGIKKTVNICSLSLASWNIIKKKLDQRINNGFLQEFYEIVFSELIEKGNLHLKGINFDAGKWYEVDTLDDLKNAEMLFRDDIINLNEKNIGANKDKITFKSSKFSNLDYIKVKKYWNNVTPSMFAPYLMEGFNFPIRAGHTRFLYECKIVRKLTLSIKSSALVLDLGSGIGTWTQFFSNEYKWVVSVESSRNLYETLQKRFKNTYNVKTIKSNVLSFKSNKKFGIIFLGGLLMYLNQKDAVSLLKKVSSWLDSGGIIICRESTLRQGILTKKNKYQAIYRSVNHYRSIFNRCNLTVWSEKINKGYISVQMSCESMKKLKTIIPQRYWNLPVMGFITYWCFRLGYPLNIKFWSSVMNMFGIEFPKLLNHYFVLKPKNGCFETV